MAGTLWWKAGVIYQIAVPSFADSNGDGWGDLRGIIEHLDHLNDGTPRSLGVDAIWLTPVNTSPMRDFGYDVVDHRSIDPSFGSLADFDELIAECHRRGMRVIMDLILNHTSNEHPWFVESRSSRDHPRRQWYVWRDGRAAGRPPNNWRSVVEGSAWEYDGRTDQYYYHAFLPFQPDLDWRNPDVRREMLDTARFWLERGVDGFRLDLVNFLYEDAALRDNPIKPGIRPWRAQSHLHDFSQPESLEVAHELRMMSDAHGERMLMGEVFSDRREDCVAFLGDGTDRLHLSFYLDFVRQRWHAEGFRRSVGWLEEHLPTRAWPCYYLDNHDLARSHSRLGGILDADARDKIVAAMLLTLRGTPILYYGQELGMVQSRIPRRLQRDPVGRKFWPLGVGRDGCRTPMQWTGEDGAGFSVGSPWLPVHASNATRNVEAETGEPDSLLSWYRYLIHLRARTPALAVGDYHEIDGVPRGVYAYLRTTPDERVTILLNFTRRTRSVTLPHTTAGRSWSVLLGTHRRRDRTASGTIVLAPHEALIAREA